MLRSQNRTIGAISSMATTRATTGARLKSNLSALTGCKSSFTSNPSVMARIAASPLVPPGSDPSVSGIQAIPLRPRSRGSIPTGSYFDHSHPAMTISEDQCPGCAGNVRSASCESPFAMLDKLHIPLSFKGDNYVLFYYLLPVYNW